MEGRERREQEALAPPTALTDDHDDEDANPEPSSAAVAENGPRHLHSFCWKRHWQTIADGLSRCSTKTAHILLLDRIPPKVRRCLRIFLQYSILGFLILVLVLWIGMEVEEMHVRNLPDTMSFYQTPTVCAFKFGPVVDDGNSSSTISAMEPEPAARTFSQEGPETVMKIQSFPNASFALISSEQSRTSSSYNSTSTTVIAHCGDCGQCSNPQDVAIYDDTRTTLFKASLKCAKRGLFGGRRSAHRCMNQAVDFTPGCNDCWVDNIMCDLRHCIFTCFFHAIFSAGVHGGSETEAVNKCTLCDERRCGPQFITCAGANRRRTAIISDIVRDGDNEVCDKVQPQEWWRDESLQEIWRVQQQVPQTPEKEDAGVQAVEAIEDGGLRRRTKEA